jgi:hypothetical protein
MSYAEYRAHRLATVDEPRVPSTWRMMWPSGMIVPNDRAARRRAERRSAEMDARRLVIPAAWFTDGRPVDRSRLWLQHEKAIARLFSAA